mmetsp:Transcript_14246/g.25527  ORF Transcript_14246/g.25527 Transcript_14246/m.25527 type:complete len:119 (+) Transcript_14246:87-443(+)
MADTGKKFTLEEISKHKTADDCWIVIAGKVYDVSKYLDEHPGGPEIVLESSGGDATEDFEDTGHSPDARDTLKQYLIGEADGVIAKKAKATSGDGPSILVVVAVLVAIAAFAFVMIEK